METKPISNSGAARNGKKEGNKTDAAKMGLGAAGGAAVGAGATMATMNFNHGEGIDEPTDNEGNIAEDKEQTDATQDAAQPNEEVADLQELTTEEVAELNEVPPHVEFNHPHISDQDIAMIEPEPITEDIISRLNEIDNIDQPVELSSLPEENIANLGNNVSVEPLTEPEPVIISTDEPIPTTDDLICGLPNPDTTGITYEPEADIDIMDDITSV